MISKQWLRATSFIAHSGAAVLSYIHRRGDAVVPLDDYRNLRYAEQSRTSILRRLLSRDAE